MDLTSQLQSLASRIQTQREFILTEEATKNAFILPFIAGLGYDVFNPVEVVPEFTADMGIKKGEKVDYAVFSDGKPIMLFECKKCGDRLDRNHASQLYRYFSVTKAQIGILTDGTIYKFYSDLEEANKMDERPFMEINLLDINTTLISELKKLAKSSLDLEGIRHAAKELKFAQAVRNVLEENFSNPTEDFIFFLTKKVHDGPITKYVKEQYASVVKEVVQQFIDDRINERLKLAISNTRTTHTPEIEQPIEEKESRVVTTEEEMEGYYIVKSILRETIDPERITHRDRISYFIILLDNNGNKPVCRLHMNTSQKYLGILDAQKNEEKIPISDINDIYKYADQIITTVGYYENPASIPAALAATAAPLPEQEVTSGM